MGKYLDNTGLQVLWNKIKSVFLPKSGGTITGNLEVTKTLSVGNCSLKNDAARELNIDATDVFLPDGSTFFATNSNAENLFANTLIDCTGSITCDKDITAQGAITANGAMTCDSLTSSIFVNAANIGADSMIEAPEIIVDSKLTIGLDSDGYEIGYFEPVNANLVRLAKANLAIGTASDSRNLTVSGYTTVEKTLYVDNIKGNSENNTNLTLGTGNNSGYVYITDDMCGKNEDGGQSWSIGANSGNASFSSVSQTSDQRLKENIQDVSTEFEEKYWATENGLIHEYDWIKSKKHANGMIAQELLNYIPEAVNYNVEADSYSVDYTSATCKIMGTMFKKIKSLENEIITMKQEIEKLKNKQL